MNLMMLHSHALHKGFTSFVLFSAVRQKVAGHNPFLFFDARKIQIKVHYSFFPFFLPLPSLLAYPFSLNYEEEFWKIQTGYYSFYLLNQPIPTPILVFHDHI